MEYIVPFAFCDKGNNKSMYAKLRVSFLYKRGERGLIWRSPIFLQRVYILGFSLFLSFSFSSVLLLLLHGLRFESFFLFLFSSTYQSSRGLRFLCSLSASTFHLSCEFCIYSSSQSQGQDQGSLYNGLSNISVVVNSVADCKREVVMA